VTHGSGKELGKIKSTINSVIKVNMSIHISQISERRDSHTTHTLERDRAYQSSHGTLYGELT
jgi:hypothetical protein